MQIGCETLARDELAPGCTHCDSSTRLRDDLREVAEQPVEPKAVWNVHQAIDRLILASRLESNRSILMLDDA